MSSMRIDKLVISNFKCFEGEFEIAFNDGMNIIVGDNDAGKSTIIEAVNLALTGFFHGRYLKEGLTQYLFNNTVVEQYLNDLEPGKSNLPPSITIDLYFAGDGLAKFQGDGNRRREKGCGVSYAIEFDEQYQPEYEELLKKEGRLTTLPIEYYTVNWSTFAYEKITSRGIPIKSALIEAMASRMINGSDVYISKIVREILDDADKVGVAQAHRKIRDTFQAHNSIKEVNMKLQTAVNVSDKKVTLAVDLATKNAWETVLMTFINEVPFHYIGRGEQSIIKTRLALSHKKSIEASVLLIEEPESHLTHTNLNKLLNRINEDNKSKQIIVTTHSSYVANKLNLDNLMLLNRQDGKHAYTKISSLDKSSGDFFRKLPGYDTLRLVLAEKALLVEGDADELIVQKAFKQKYGTLPIEAEVEVISVGTSFLRFLEIAQQLGKKVAVVTDNDGDVEGLDTKYVNYIGNKAPAIGIFFDREIDEGDLTVGKKKTPFNYNTLEPKIVKANNIEALNGLLGKSFSNLDDLHIHMRANKTDVALALFETTKKFTIPPYITDAISWISEDEEPGAQ